MQLVLSCARSRLTSEDTSRLRELLSRPFDWEKVVQIATHHRTLSLLYWHLKDIADGRLPEGIWNQLRTHFQKTTHRNLFLTRELLQLIENLRTRGIAAITLKGPVLTAQYYGNPGFRSFIDLDLLVQADDLERCKELLRTLGYHAPENQQGKWAEQHRKAQLGFDFLRSDGLVRLEVHWAFIQKWLSFRVTTEQLWSRMTTVKLAGLPVPSLAPEDNLVYLCAHGAKHQWERLIWICDIAELIRTETALQWEEVLSRAQESGSRRNLLWGLRLAHELLGAEVPAHFLKAARSEAAVESLFQESMKKLCGGAEQGSSVGPDSRTDAVYLLGMDRLVDRCHYLWHLAKLFAGPSDKDREMIRLPVGLSFLYLLLRPLRILLCAIPVAIRKMNHSN